MAKFYIIKDEQIKRLILNYYKEKKQERNILNYATSNFFDIFTLLFDKQKNTEEIAIDESLNEHIKTIILLLRDNFLEKPPDDLYDVPDEYIEKIIEETGTDESRYSIIYMPDTKITVPTYTRLAMIAEYISPYSTNSIYEILRKFVEGLMGDKVPQPNRNYIIEMSKMIIQNFVEEKREKLSKVISAIEKVLKVENDKERSKELEKIHKTIIEIEDEEKQKRSIESFSEVESLLDNYLEIKTYKKGILRINIKGKSIIDIPVEKILAFHKMLSKLEKEIEKDVSSIDSGNANNVKYIKKMKEKQDLKHFLGLDTLYKILAILNADFRDRDLRRVIDFIKSRGKTGEFIYKDDFEIYLSTIELYILKKYISMIDDYILFNDPIEEENVYTLLYLIKDSQNAIYIYESYESKGDINVLQSIKRLLKEIAYKNPELLFYIHHPKDKDNEKKTYLVIKTSFFDSVSNLPRSKIYKFFVRERFLKKTVIIEDPGNVDKSVFYIIDLDELLEKLHINREEYLESVMEKAELLNENSDKDE